MENKKKKLLRPSKTDLKKALLESLFDPRNPGPMAAVVDSSTSDYLLRRSIEFIQEVRDMQVDLTSVGARDRLNKAISLLALAKLLK